MHLPEFGPGIAFGFAVFAGILDVAANLASTKSEGFAKRGWGLLSILLVVAAFAMLAEAFKSIDIAIAYATLGATGIFGTAICGRIFFGNRLQPIGWIGLVVIFAAVVVLHSADQSTHKILSGLSQAATLHLCSEKVDESRVQAALQALQTTSPNFAIMASIDLARRQMMQEGQSRLADMLAQANFARAEIKAIDGLGVMGWEHALGDGSGFTTLDRTKILIDTSKLGWSGSESQRFLNREFGVQPELSGPGYLLCILTLGSIEEDVHQLLRGLSALSSTCPPTFSDFSSLNELAGRTAEHLPEAVMSPRDAFYAKQRFVSPRQALGCISGEVITPYPPGIPVIMPGERFNCDIIELLEAVRRSGCPISSVDPSMATMKIVV